MVLNWLKRKNNKSKLSLVVFGTEFGSYQFLQLVQASSKYQVVGFISTDPWQQRSGFGKIGVIYPAELAALCKKQNVLAIVVTSDQREPLDKDRDMGPVREMEHLIRECEILAIPQIPDREQADTFIDQLL